MKHIVLTFFLSLCLSGVAQEQLNNYKYIIIPKKLGDFKKENQYQTSTLVKHLFTQKGFNTVYDDALPEALASNICLGLAANILDNSNMFSTKAAIILKDCTGKEIFVTEEGASRLKQYKPAYLEAFTEAFQSFYGDYQYEGEPEKEAAPVTVSYKNDIKEVVEETEKEVESKPTIVEKEEQAMEQVKETVEEVAPKTQEVEPVVSEAQNNSNVLYAQELNNGYQLVDSTPSIQLKIYKSALPNVYHAANDKVNGLVYNKNGKWFFEYYENGTLQVEELNIKF